MLRQSGGKHKRNALVRADFVTRRAGVPLPALMSSNKKESWSLPLTRPLGPRNGAEFRRSPTSVRSASIESARISKPIEVQHVDQA
jgi:hypothetical protein